jgi:hypothetical protein
LPLSTAPLASLGSLGSLAVPLGLMAGIPLAALAISDITTKDFVSKGGETLKMRVDRFKFERNLAMQMGELARYDKGKFNPGDYGYESFGNHKYNVSPTTNVYITMSKDGKVLDTRTVINQTTGGIQ